MRAAERPGRVMTSPTRRVRVVHLLLTMDVGGLERVAVDLARKSDPDRFDCRIVCLRDPGDFAPVARELGVRVEALGAHGWVDGLCRLTRRLWQIRPHVLHTHNPGAHRVGVPARLLARVPVLVHTKHGRNYPDNPRAVAMNRRLARFSDAIVAVSHDAARVAVEIEHIPVTKVRVIHNGIEPGEPLSPRAWDSWQPRAITVARLDPVKDQPTMLRAIRRVVDVCPDFRLDIVGDGPDRSMLERLTRDLALEANVSFHGYRRDVGTLLRRPQIFLLSSISEGIALTLLEAMAAGLPVVATDVGGNREVVEPKVTGLLVPPRRPDELAEAVLALRDPLAARALGAAGRVRLEHMFDLRRTIDQYSQLYEDQLRGAPRMRTR
jgi:glycosyltransferase involved in cell wall biosynthesis